MNPSIDSYTGRNIQWLGGVASTTSTAPDIQKDFWGLASTVFYTDEDAKMNKREIQLLQEYKQLDYDWDLEGAVAPSPEAILLAEYIVKAMEKTGQKVFHVAPGPRGEIMVDIRNSSRSLELLFYPHSNNKYVFFSENNEAEQGAFVFSLLPQLLNRLNA